MRHVAKTILWGLGVGCVAATIGVGRAGAAEQSVEEVVRAGTAAWLAAYNAGDVAGVARLYAADAVVMPPGAPAAVGRKAIRVFLTSDIAAAQEAGVTLVQGEMDDAGASEHLAWHSGSYTVNDATGAVVDSGSFLEVWRKTGGQWRILRDTWNSDRPPAAHTSAVEPEATMEPEPAAEPEPTANPEPAAAPDAAEDPAPVAE